MKKHGKGMLKLCLPVGSKKTLMLAITLRNYPPDTMKTNLLGTNQKENLLDTAVTSHITKEKK